MKEEKAKSHTEEILVKDLRLLRKHTEDFWNFSPIPICGVNAEFIVISVGKRFLDFFGYNQEEIIGEGLEKIFESKKEFQKLKKDLLEGEIITRREIVAQNRNGGELPVSVFAKAQKNDENITISYFFSFIDIVEIKKKEEELKQKIADIEKAKKKAEREENKTRAILLSLTDGLILFNREMQVSLVNSVAEDILGVKEKKVLGRKIDQMGDYPNLNKLYKSLGENIEWIGRRYEFILEKPVLRVLQTVVVPVEVNKETIGIMIVLHDISREKEIERMKSEFVSVVAHQLRTPLSAVKWVIGSILDGDAGEVSLEQLNLLGKGYRSNERMINLVNDLLNIARIEEGRFLSGFALVSVDNLVKSIVKNSEKAIKSKDINVVIKKTKKKLPKIRIDIERIKLVIQNLLDNAVRYSLKGGKVTISVGYDKMNIKVEVKDEGIGISKHQQGHVFTKFFRGDNAVRAETEGSGLGLFMCKNIIEAHGGEIGFKSEKDKGTAFWFTLSVKSEEMES